MAIRWILYQVHFQSVLARAQISWNALETIVHMRFTRGVGPSFLPGFLKELLAKAFRRHSIVIEPCELLATIILSKVLKHLAERLLY